jgi:hypothetical protein
VREFAHERSGDHGLAGDICPLRHRGGSCAAEWFERPEFTPLTFLRCVPDLKALAAAGFGYLLVDSGAGLPTWPLRSMSPR